MPKAPAPPPAPPPAPLPVREDANQGMQDANSQARNRKGMRSTILAGAQGGQLGGAQTILGQVNQPQ